MYVQHRIGAQQRIFDQGPERADTDAIRPGKPYPLERLVRIDALGLVELEPEQPSSVRDRWGLQLAAAPAGAVGPRDHELRPVRRAREAAEHGHGEVGRAEIDRAHAGEGSPATLGGLLLLFGLAERAHGFLALLLARAVEDQHAVEVVDLVLDHSCLEPGGLHAALGAVLVLRLHADIDRTLDVDGDAGDREAALLEALLVVARPLDLGVDERDERRVLADAVDEQALAQPDLRGREADAERVVHEPAHTPDLRTQRVVEPVHWRGAALQHRIAEAADERHGRGAARLDLGVLLLYLGLDFPGVLLE